MKIKAYIILLLASFLSLGCSRWDEVQVNPDSLTVNYRKQKITLKAEPGKLGGALDVKVVYSLTNDAICNYEYSDDYGFLRIKGEWFDIQCFRWSDEITVFLTENRSGAHRKLTLDITRALATQKGYTTIHQTRK